MDIKWIEMGSEIETIFQDTNPKLDFEYTLNVEKKKKKKCWHKFYCTLKSTTSTFDDKRSLKGNLNLDSHVISKVITWQFKIHIWHLQMGWWSNVQLYASSYINKIWSKPSYILGTVKHKR